jgi:23S rRNA (cytidine1920-2'-O)/16S rRNA (cytidine1409-2'-O)-methyltransferase
VGGGAVVVDGRVAGKPAQPVGPESQIQLTEAPSEWVGRAALKLLHAIELWGAEGAEGAEGKKGAEGAEGKKGAEGTAEVLHVAHRRCLDVGASTGGFTQVLLARGAEQVTALDVGHGQLVPFLAEDPRVRDLPGTNIRGVEPADLGGAFDLVVADLSFISLTLVLPVLRRLVTEDGDLVVLVKPQFEVGRERLGRGGVVTSPHEHRRVLRDIRDASTAEGLRLVAVAASPIRGGDGNREFLFWLTPRPAPTDVHPTDVHPTDVQSGRDDMLDTFDVEGET